MERSFHAIDKEKIKAHVDVLDIVKKEPEKFIESADVLVVAGRGIKKEEDLAMIRELAELLDGQVACTRPLAEAGWVEAKCQVGLSGRTVRPKLIITCGVSGAIQFVAEWITLTASYPLIPMKKHRSLRQHIIVW